MRNVEVLIIGGGVAGTTAAETYRAGGGQGEVLIVGDEPHRLYSRVLLPHAVKGTISPEKVFLRTEASYGEKAVELLAGKAVLRVDMKRRTAHLDDGSEVAFRKLVIAVGGVPRRWDVEGGDLSGVLRFQTFDDARKIAETLTEASALVIVGSGFIALEFAAIAAKKGAKGVLLNRGPHFWSSMLGGPVAAAVEAAVGALGVTVRHGVKVARVVGQTAVEGIETSTGEIVPASAVGLGIGIEAPIEPFGDMKGEHGIRTDAQLETIHEDVWAAGDCAEFEDPLLGGLRHVVGNWTNAVAQGRHVGKALLGERKPYATLTQYTTNVVPGASLIFLGECRNLRGSAAETVVLEEGRKIAEYRTLEGRTIGAILLNAPELRAEAIERIELSP
jgi:3-phenylpropionate/trans-cinnamate dioxygenase ferredoxin reductase subunit